jgi:hypothetical protein
MAEETKGRIDEERKETRQGGEAEEEPQVFAVKKGLSGWRFSRRDFLAATGGAVVAVVTGAAAGCKPGGGGEAAPTECPPTSPDTLVPTGSPAGTPRATSTPAQGHAPGTTPGSSPPKARFVRDVTIPDGTVMEPGQSFTKTWRVENNGVVPWGEGTQLVFARGAEMGAASPVSVGDAAPGETVDISVDMVAPMEPGEYTGRWHLRAADGTVMVVPYVVIVVGSAEPGEPAEVPPGEPGEVPPGETGINLAGPSGETRWMPCGSPIPPGWTCVCNCVSVPAPCSCDGVCACVGHTTCTCDAVHYWYPC